MVGKMNSRWQSDNPVRSIGEYLPLRRRCTHAALTHRNTRPMYAETRLYCTWRRDTLMYRQICAVPRRVRVYVDLRACFCACTYTRPAHIESPSAGATSRTRERAEEEERTCTMHECVRIHTGPGWIYSRRNFATRGAAWRERNARGREREEPRSAARDARVDGRRPSAWTAEGVVGGPRIFDLRRRMRNTSNER